MQHTWSISHLLCIVACCLLTVCAEMVNYWNYQTFIGRVVGMLNCRNYFPSTCRFIYYYVFSLECRCLKCIAVAVDGGCDLLVEYYCS